MEHWRFRLYGGSFVEIAYTVPQCGHHSFFAEPHYDHVLRGGRFFLELFDSLDIEYKDFRDLLHPFAKSLLKLVNPLLALSPADYTTRMWIQRLQYLFNRFILSEQRFAEFLNSFEPDCIIIDDRKYYLRPFCGY
jgi:hypothetical protein